MGSRQEVVQTQVMSSGEIFIVDDDRDTRNALAELLEAEGFAVDGAANGREALARLRSRDAHPAVILLDLMMPGMDGWDFRSEQMRDPELASVPVVIVSASGFSPESIRIPFRPAAYVGEPIERATLLGVLREVVGSGAPGQLDPARGTGEPQDERP